MMMTAYDEIDDADDAGNAVEDDDDEDEMQIATDNIGYRLGLLPAKLIQSSRLRLSFKSCE